MALAKDELELATAAAKRFGATAAVDLMKQERWYRIDAESPSMQHLMIHCFAVLSRTKHGVWLDRDGTGVAKRWVSLTAVKRYAYPTRELALESFIRRKRRQILILERLLAGARTALHLASNNAADLFKHTTDSTELA